LWRVESHLEAQDANVTAMRRELAALHAQPPAPAPVVPAPAAGAVLDRDAVEAIARAVVGAQEQRDRAIAAASARASADPPPRALEQEKRVARAREAVARAVTTGQLSIDAVRRMREDLAAGDATPAERDAVRSQIAVAINAQKLRPEDPRFIYP
jgi:hypothetical protein